MPFFSIIIPLYNKELFLEKTLQSVFKQTFFDYEIIIINDGSTDKSLEIAQSFQNEKVKIYSQDNQGVSAARNKGIKESTTNYYCFLDADDLWKPNHLESLYNLIQKFPKAGLYCSRYEFEISKNRTIQTNFDFEDSYEGYLEDFFRSSLIYRIATGSSTCLPKKTYTEIGGFDTKITNAEDTDFWTQIALKHKVAISNKSTAIYNYRIENKSLSKIDIKNRLLPDFDKYAEEEKQNNSLKQFLDLYRIEFALHYHISGNKEKKDFYLKNVCKESINKKTRILFKVPSYFLRKMLFTKRYLKQFGIDFSVYH